MILKAIVVSRRACKLVTPFLPSQKHWESWERVHFYKNKKGEWWLPDVARRAIRIRQIGEGSLCLLPPLGLPRLRSNTVISIQFFSWMISLPIKRSDGSVPDPYVSWPPGSTSGSVSRKYGSGSGSFTFLIRMLQNKNFNTNIFLLKI